jgi:hypothetical protein
MTSSISRSGMRSTAMPFLGLDRDLVVAEVMRRRDWRIAGVVGGWHPTSRSTRSQKGEDRSSFRAHAPIVSTILPWMCPLSARSCALRASPSG